MSNNSATGGFLTPTSSSGFPGGLTLNQFIQQTLVGISGLDKKLVRPSWQAEPVPQPNFDVNWLAFGIEVFTPDTNIYSKLNGDGSTSTQRQQTLKVRCSMFGPDAIELTGVLIDGFQLLQNLEQLKASNMNFAYSTEPRLLPDLVNARWINRIITDVYLRRQIDRTYGVLPILSAEGAIHTELKNPDGSFYELPFVANNQEDQDGNP